MPRTKSGGSEGDGNPFELKWITYALVLLVFVSIFFVQFMPSHVEEGTEWEQEVADLQDRFYAQTGGHSTPEQNIWTLTGIYTPYGSNGTHYGYTDDGWVYGEKVKQDTPIQYEPSSTFGGKLIVAQAQKSGLFYYISVPDNFEDIVVLKECDKVKKTVDGNEVDEYVTPHNNNYTIENGQYNIYDTTGATVYSAVSFNKEYKSNIFFTSSSREEVSQGHYTYAFTGQRYVFQPLKDYSANIDGQTQKINARSTSLSLIWYEYTEMTSGIAGQLAISGTDKGVSYLTADDIIREFNANNFTSTFDMTFNGGVQMHLSIRLDPARLSASSANNDTIRQCYNNGYWSVLVYSDAVVDSVQASTYEFSADNILGTIISLLTFNIAQDYDIDGWMGTFASLLVTLPFYSALLVIVLQHAYLWPILAIVTILQTIATLGTGWWPFG